MNQFLRKVYRKANKFIGRYNSYIERYDNSKPWVFVSYITAPFYNKNDSSFLNGHQNNREVLIMAEVFKSLGYNSYFMEWNSHKELPDINVEIVFGHEPNFTRACEKYTAAKKIYYGVSTYFVFRNNKIKQMTDHFNSVFHANVPCRRLVTPNDSVKMADKILLIGSEYTKKTFPKEYRNKITLIHQSTQTCKFLKDISASKSNNFFFLASGGNILKGVGCLIEYFTKHLELNLHWVGPVEREVYSAIKNRLTPNIYIYGYQDIGSDLVLSVMKKCNFIIYPSGTEGVPGSVLNAMKSGLIPLVTPWASFDGVERMGFVMEDADDNSIGKAIDWALSLSIEDIYMKKITCQKFVNETYNLVMYRREFEDYMISVLAN